MDDRGKRKLNVKLRNRKWNLTALALTLGGAIALTGCSAAEEAETRLTTTATAEPIEQQPAEKPAPEPEPVVPAWEDLAGTWCGGGIEGYPADDPCTTIVLGSDGTPVSAEHPESLVAFREMVGECFSGFNGAEGTPGATAISCTAGVAATKDGLVDPDHSQDRLWVAHGPGALPYCRS